MTNALDALNFDISELADVPEYRIFPEGTHRVQIFTEVKNSKAGKPMVVWKLRALETFELANESERGLSEGESNTVYFSLASEWGMGALKKAITPIGNALGISNLKDIITAMTLSEEAGDPVVAIITTSIKKPRKDKPEDSPSLNIINVIID